MRQSFLSWTHYIVLLQVFSKEARDWYEKEALIGSWFVRTLQRNVSSDYYHRMLLSQKKDLVKEENHNPTLGIVLCDDTDEDIAKYSVLNGNEQLFASKYKLYLPSEEELKAEIENQKTMFYLQHKK